MDKAVLRWAGMVLLGCFWLCLGCAGGSSLSPRAQVESIVPFTDPVTHQTYDIIDGRVLVCLANEPQIPVMDPNYFDVYRPPTDPYYALFDAAIAASKNDPAKDAFIAAERLEVISEWPEVGVLLVFLPPGGTVLDAVTRWPVQYPAVVESAEPDALVSLGLGDANVDGGAITGF